MIKTEQLYILILVCFFCPFTIASDLMPSHPDVCAYLDPGTGSFIFQMLIAGFVGGLFALKLFWAKIKIFITALFSKRKKEDDSK